MRLFQRELDREVAQRRSRATTALLLVLMTRAIFVVFGPVYGDSGFLEIRDNLTEPLDLDQQTFSDAVTEHACDILIDVTVLETQCSDGKLDTGVHHLQMTMNLFELITMLADASIRGDIGFNHVDYL